MVVVHWNLHHGGVPVNSKGANKVLNVQAITNWLVKFNPDIVSLNELEQNDSYGNTDQLEHHRAALELAQGVPWYSAFGAMNGGSVNKGIGVGLLSKTAMNFKRNHALYGARPMLAALAGESIGLFVTHTDPDSQVKRSIEVTQMLCLQQPMGSPILFTGDFNAIPTSIEMAAIPQLGYLDAWVEAKKVKQATSFTTDGATKGHRIDYIWYRGLTVVGCDVPDTSTDGIFPSDHHPVVATFI